MHELQELVHTSILALDAHHPDGDDRPRDWFRALYDFQSTYEYEWTMRPVQDVLVRRRHTYRLPIAEHPDYAERRPFFDGLTGFTELREFDDYEEWPEGALDDGYLDPPWLYCEAGSTLWQRLVDVGRLTGADTVPPRKVPLLDAVLAVMTAAERDGNPELIALWWALGPDVLLPGASLDPHVLAAVPGVVALRETVRRSGALTVPLPAGYRPSDEQLDRTADEREIWWYRIPPYWQERGGPPSRRARRSRVQSSRHGSP